MNWIGLVAALTTFLSIWSGHVIVRKVEAAAARLWIPISIAMAIGLGLEYWSLTTPLKLPSTALGILGITVLWDAFELFRQEERVKKGHAPANVNNPRHARLLLDHPTATTVDLVKREPTGIPNTIRGK